jgi:hypothetical protein
MLNVDCSTAKKRAGAVDYFELARRPSSPNSDESPYLSTVCKCDAGYDTV